MTERPHYRPVPPEIARAFDPMVGPPPIPPTGPLSPPGTHLAVPGALRNPGTSDYTDEEVEGWTQPLFGIPWQLAAPPAGLTGIDYATWQSPIFDLRPDLGKQFAGVDPSDAFPLPSSGEGDGRALIMQLYGMLAVANTLEVYWTELAHLWDPAAVVAINIRQNITTDVWDSGASRLLPFEPPSGPPRFWSVQLEFVQTDGNIGDLVGTLTAEAAAY